MKLLNKWSKSRCIAHTWGEKRFLHEGINVYTKPYEYLLNHPLNRIVFTIMKEL